ncbi:MAG: sodium:glutamate symporter [Oscillospiraceae bacterium]|nr:sodium:glutamate symporter [Oscillospiraceae bacterium]
MDYSAANIALWNIVIQLGVIAASILLANYLRARFSFVRKSMMPTAVLGGFLLLSAKYLGIVSIDGQLMEMLVYHGIALGFIAMSLRVPDMANGEKGDMTGLKSGAIIVSAYLVQGITGLLITLFLSYTFIPTLFKASGLLLPMGYGQGPGQANNVGSTYEALGFEGGRSFGLSIAATGYLVACIVGVILLNILVRRGKVRAASDVEHKPDVSFFQSKDEIPVSDSIDKLSVQIAMVLLVYLATFLCSWGLTSGISAISTGLAKTLNTLIWGFNFIFGSALAMLLRVTLEVGKKKGLIRRQYQNNYLLNRISGFFFDIMIVAGIASINLEDLSGLWIPFLMLAAAGAVVTWLHLKFVCRKVYPDYYYEGLISMYGMLTGTISSGVLLLREVDPGLSTPAANNLVIGSSFGIILGAPILILVGLAPKSDLLCWVTLLIAAIYFAALLVLITRVHRRKGIKK